MPDGLRPLAGEDEGDVCEAHGWATCAGAVGAAGGADASVAARRQATVIDGSR